MSDLDLRALLESWTIHLRAERKAEGTVRLYATGVRAFLAWCDRQGRPAVLDRPTVAAFVAELLNDGREAATARARQLALRRFAVWLAEEGELDADPLAGLKPPKLDSKVVPVLSDQQLRALLAACQGPALRDRRDEALVRLLTETGLRAGETVALRVEDVDLHAGTLHVRRGRGGKGAAGAVWPADRPRPGPLPAAPPPASPGRYPGAMAGGSRSGLRLRRAARHSRPPS
jgi:integrase/recombinase XerD